MDETPDYSKYTLDQLHDVYDHIDKEKYPERLNLIVQEIEKRRPDPLLQDLREKKEANLTNKWRKPLAVTEVIGGVSLLFGGVQIIYGYGRDSVLLGICILILGAIAVLAGITLYKDTTIGIKLSLFLQILQLFSVSTSDLFYHVIAGLNLNYSWIYSSDMFQENGWRLAYGISGAFFVSGSGHGQPHGFGINFIALSAMLLLILQPGNNIKRRWHSSNWSM